MKSKKWPSQHGSMGYAQTFPQKRPPETTLVIERLQIERKEFRFILKENDRGRFLRIIEEVNGRRNAVIVPVTGLEEMSRVLQEMVCADIRGNATAK